MRTRPALAAALLVGAGCAPGLPDPVPLRLVAATEITAPPGELMHDLLFHDPEGGDVTAVLRQPATAGPPRSAAVLVAGRETGRQAAAVIQGPLEEVVLALEYPDALPEDIGAGAALAHLPEIRATALRMPGLLRGAAAWLGAQEIVDAERMVLVGVSYGVPFAAAAGRDPIFAGVALHHGGADLALLLRHNLDVRPGLLRRVLGRLGAWIFRPIEPALHVGHIAPTPLLLINAEHDELIPRESVERMVRAAREPVRLIWLPHGHLMPGDDAQMRELADSTLAHFQFLRPGFARE